MKKVIFGDVLKKTEIFIEDVGEGTPIFSRRNGVIDGFLHQNAKMGYKWIHCLGGCTGSSGFHSTRTECIEMGKGYGYEFFIDQGGTHRKILLEKRTDIIHYSGVPEDTPIFAVREGSGEIRGVIVNNGYTHDPAWVLKLGGNKSSNGSWLTRELCMRNTATGKYDFYIEIEI